MTARRKPSALRAALAGKTTRETFYDIPLRRAGETNAQAADRINALRERLQEARRTLAMAPYTEKPDEVKATAQAAIDELTRELSSCFHRLHFRGLAGDDEYNDLIDAHPPTEEQKAKDKEATLDLASFQVALLMACLIDESDLTADEWRDELWSWPRPERTLLFQRVREANEQAFGDVGNG